MEKAEFQRVAEAMLGRSPSGHGSLIPGVDYTNDGLLILTMSEQKATAGFGIASDLTPTAKLLGIVATLNQQMDFGHYWLAEGADNDHWCLVAGFKFHYPVIELNYTAEMLSVLVRAHVTLRNAVLGHLDGTPHSVYWPDPSPDDVEARALVLMSHLG